MSEEQWGDDMIDFSQPPVDASSVRKLSQVKYILYHQIYTVTMDVIN